MPDNRKINLHARNHADGSKTLVFEAEGTRECVAEIRIAYENVGYLPTISELFSNWARVMNPIVRSNGINGHSTIKG